MKQKKIYLISLIGIFIALDIVFARFLTFTIPGFAKIDFQFVVAVFAGYFLGPLYATITLIIADLVGVLFNSGSLGVFLGFTLSAALRGLLLGILFKYRRLPKPTYIIITISFVYIFIDIFLNNFWLSIITDSQYIPLLLSRLAPRLILLILINIVSIACLKIAAKHLKIQPPNTV